MQRYGHRTVRQLKRIAAIQKTELSRRAHLYLARNTTLPTNIRLAAQLALSNQDQFGSKTRPAEVRMRCIASDAGRAVQAKQTGLNRVQFKLKLQQGLLPGWAKCSW